MGYLIILRGSAGSGKHTIGKSLVEKLEGKEPNMHADGLQLPYFIQD